MLRAWAVLALLAASVAAAAEAPAAKLPSFDFENGIGEWASLSTAGQAAPTAIAAHVRGGQMALGYSYEPRKGEPPLLMVPVQGLPGFGSLRLDVLTDTPTILLVALVEEGQARYQYASATPAKAWLHLEIDRSEFALAEDSPDANNRLDLEQVRCILFADLRAVLTGEGGELAGLFGLRPGRHAFWLDNVEARPEPAVAPRPDGSLVIDDFRRENLGWMPLEGISLSAGPAPGGAVGRALRLDYTTEAGKLAAILRFLPPGALAGMEQIAFAAAAEREISLAVVLEELGGARYLGTFRVPGGSRVQRFSLALDKMTLAEDTTDANGRLDRDQVKSIGFVDLAGLEGAPPAGKSVLWLQEVSALPPAGKP